MGVHKKCKITFYDYVESAKMFNYEDKVNL